MIVMWRRGGSRMVALALAALLAYPGSGFAPARPLRTAGWPSATLGARRGDGAPSPRALALHAARQPLRRGELREAARSVPECGNDDECVVEEVENRVLPLLAGGLGLAAASFLAFSNSHGIGLGQLSDALATIDVKQFLEDMVGIVERSGPLG